MKPLSVLTLLCTLAVNTHAQQATSGRSVTSIELPDARDNKKMLPLAQKVTAIFYTDPDAKDVIDPLSKVIEKWKLSKNNFAGIGVINCKDTWMPNAVMRAAVRQKEKDDPTSVILFDKSRSLPAAWGLGDCDDACMLVIIGTDSKVKFSKAIRSQDECRTIITPVMKLLDEEVAKSN